jgi:hypothetical protein
MPDPFLEAARTSEPDPFLAAAKSAAPASAPAAPEPGDDDPFLAAATKKPSATILQKTQAALGRGVQEGGRLLTGVAAQFGKLAPYDLRVGEGGKVSLKDISGEIDERRDKVRKTVNQLADTVMHASDADRQPGNIVEKLAYGLVEFMPLAPVYEVLGGPGARVVDAALTSLSERFGPAIARKVAEKLPEAMQKAGKYVGELTAKGLRMGAEGATAELVAGSTPEQALETGVAFGAYSAAFKGLLKDPLKAAKRHAWDAKTEPEAEKVVDPFEKAAGVVDPQMEKINRYAETSRGFDEREGFQRASGGPGVVHPDWFEGMEPSEAAKKIAEKTAHPPRPEVEELHSLGSMFSTKEGREARKKEVDDYLRGNGFEVVGIQEHPRHGDLFWFTDPKTGSTLLMPLEDMTPEGITKHVQESREKFGIIDTHSLGSMFSKPRNEWKPDDHIRLATALNRTDPVETFYDYAFSRLEKESPAAGKVFTYTRKMGQQVRDFLDLNGIPSLTRLGVADEAFEHGGAHLAGPRITDDLIAKAMGADYKDWRKKSLFMGLLVKDRILAGHEYNRKLRDESLAEAQRLSGEVQTAQEEIWLYETGLEGKKLTPKVEEHLQSLYDKRNELQREQATHDAKAAKQHEIVTKIEEKHNIQQYDWDVQNAIRRNYIEWLDKDKNVVSRLDNVQERVNAWNHPENGVTTYLDKLWKEAKNIAPDEELAETGTYGKHTKTRISLVTKDEPSMSGATGKRLKEESEAPGFNEWIGKKVDAALSADAKAGVPRGTADVGRDPKDYRAYFTGDYSLSMEKNLNNTIRPRLEKSTKENLYKALEDKGVIRFDQLTAKDFLQEGVEWVKWPQKVERPTSSADPEAGGYQRTALVPRDMWVRSDAMTELQGVLNVGVNMKPFPWTQLATRVQLFQVVDFVTHAKNLLSEVARAQGKGKGADIATRIPLVSTGDAVGRISKVFAEVRSDTPEIRAEMASLAKMGVLRPVHGQDAILPTGKWLWEIDTASRVLMNRFYDQLVKEGKAVDNLTARRNYINQVGQYNDRFMTPWMRFARRAGVSPFVVAGRTFNRNATRVLTGKSGAEATSPEAEADMRRLNLMTVAMSATIPMMVNTWTTGNPLGRPGTPLFGIDLGRKQKDDGSHDVIDLGQATGLARATREWGIADTYAGLRAGQTPEQIGSKAALSVSRGRSHPWTGPGVAFGLDWLKEGPKTAVQKINPTVVNPLSKEGKGGPLETKFTPESGERNIPSRLGTLLDTFISSPSGAFGYKSVRAPRSAAEQYVTEHRYKGEITEEKKAMKKVRDHAEILLRESEDQGREYLQKQIEAGKIETDYAERIVRELPLSKLQRGFSSLSAKHEKDTALEAYRLASIQEKAQLFRLLEQKVENQSEKISEAKLKKLDAFLDDAFNELREAFESGKLKPEELYEKE